MRTIHYIVVHCTATRQDATVAAIRRYWKDTLGWRSPGYHYMIDAGGVVHALHPIEKPSNGVKGHNANSIHISYIGGVDAMGMPTDNRTDAQRNALRTEIAIMKEQFPKAVIQGHRDFAGVGKACPSFDARTEYAYL